MRPELNDEAWGEIEQNVANLKNNLDDKHLKEVLRKIGQAVKKKVKSYAPPKSNEPSFSDFAEGQYKHIRDDITYKIKKSSTGELYVSVRGGKTTGYKWHWVNDGHVAQNGRFVQGTHFVDKAQADAESDINDVINDFMKEILEDG